MNRQFRLQHRPDGRLKESDVVLAETPVPKPAAGEVLFRNLYLSMEPVYRLWLTDTDHDLPPVALGDVVRGVCLGRVVATEATEWKMGDIGIGLFGWQDYALVTGPMLSRVARVPSGTKLSPRSFLGSCGSTGFCAYFGLRDIGRPKRGETVVVSAAAGAVGSVAGQIARIEGCRAVGIAGGAEKCRVLIEKFGFDAAVDYKDGNWRQRLADATPNGIDVDFENVGGDIMDEVISRMNRGGRVVLCGLISGYNEGDRRSGHLEVKGNFVPIFTRRLTVQGFVFTDYTPRFGEAARQLAQWVEQGRIKERDTVIDGLENAPQALNRLFDGNNIGKLLVRIEAE